MFGHSAREAVGRLIELIIPPEERADHWAGFRAAMAENAIRYRPDEPLDAEALTRDGLRIPIDVFLDPVRDVDGRIAALNVTIRRR